MASYLPNESRGETPARQSIETWKSNGIEDKKRREKPRKKKRTVIESVLLRRTQRNRKSRSIQKKWRSA